MTKLEKATTALLIIMVIGAMVLMVAGPYFEARAFNKFSSKKASYFDAVFLNLRVEAKP